MVRVKRDFTRTLSDLLELLYQAPGEPVKWDLFVRRLLEETGYAQGLFVHHDASRQQTQLATAINVEPEFLHSYAEHFCAINPYLTLPEASLPREGTFGALDEILPSAVVERTEFFHDYVAPQRLTVRGALRMTAFHNGSLRTSLALHPSREDPDLTERALVLAELLMPHLRTALHLHNRIAMAESSVSRLKQTLDHLPMGVVALDAAGRPLAVNATAEQTFICNDGLSLGADGIRVMRQTEANRLKALIASAAATAAGNGTGGGGVVRIRRLSNQRPFELLVAPLSPGDEDAWPEPAVGIFLHDPESAPESASDLLRRLYGLTPAEARVAGQLMGGDSLEAIGGRLGVTRDTVKTQLGHIFAKTDTHRQAELVRLLSSGLASLIDPSQGTGLAE